LIEKAWKCWEVTQKLIDLVNEGGKLAVPQRLRGFVAFGTGFFYFGLSLVPENMNFLVKLLGFAPGDRVRAAELLLISKEIPACGKSIESALLL
jgi:hypothetical protein